MISHPQHVIIKDDSRLQQLNDRICGRNLPSQTMNTVFDPRPSTTRRQIFPVLDAHAPASTPIRDTGHYRQGQMFNPGDRAPFSGFARAVDSESALKNIFMSRQKFCNQTQYAPSTTSKLYRAPAFSRTLAADAHPLLGPKPVAQQAPDTSALGGTGGLFNTDTRQQRLGGT
jgi:hypothetical protein